MNAIATRDPQAIAQRAELDVADVIAQVRKIQMVMAEVMKEGEHYGVIPGTDKPTLLKPGAEKLCLTFRLDPQYEVTTEKDGDHLTKESTCTLYHIPSGLRYGSGMGSCSTKESRYAYRYAKRACPRCGMDTIMKSKYPPKSNPRAEPGWYCFAKRGGCGVEFAVDDEAITGQKLGRVANDDKADQYNTVLKMANKRSLVAAVLNVTAASDIFTQDLEDNHDAGQEARSVSDGAPRVLSGVQGVHDAGADRPDGPVSVPPVREARVDPDDPALVAESKELFRDPAVERLVAECTEIINAQLKAKKITQADVRAFKTTYLGAENADPWKCDVAVLNDLHQYLTARFAK